MKTNFTAQEIIFVTNTKFAAKEYQENKNDRDNSPRKTGAEKLANDCWNGMLRDRLPEISMQKYDRPLPIWELHEGNSLFYIKLGERNLMPDAEFTLNPYRFMAGKRLN